MRRLLYSFLAIPLAFFFLTAEGCEPSQCDRTANPSTFGAQYSAATSGQVLCLTTGNYGNVGLGKSITLAALKNNTPTLTTLNITADNSTASALNITGGGDPLVTVAQSASNVIIAGNKIHDGSGNGMRNRGDYVTVSNNEFYHFGSEDAIRFWGDHHTYSGNYIHDVSNSGHNDAFQTYRTSPGDEAVTNLVMDGNTIRTFSGSNAHCLIVSDGGSQHWDITNNWFDGIGSHCLIIGLHMTGEGVADLQIHDNIFANIGGTAIFCDGGGGISWGSITGNSFSNIGGANVSRDPGTNCTGQT